MPANNRPLLIGITGSIGSGKSSFSRFICQHGFRVISADAIANQHLKDRNVIAWLSQRWGNCILDGDVLDRQKIAEIAFNDPVERSFLNSVLHPLVLRDFQQIVSKAIDQYLFFEVPLLYEADLQGCFDYVILITASFESRIQRLYNRNPGNLQNQIQRLRSQIPDEIKAEWAHLVVDNSDSLTQLEQAVDDFCQRLTALPYRQIQKFTDVPIA
ncbi:MAG TPA: dephospho-CoA kinase [Candidatus Cloacimonadota bacterium]|nr:dephospho-CoA kinase [Candidatus Cloacimonadota bacterium]